ncbi:hypothetical protein PENTCL1PPCAC_11283 [Pristionchus entomophagus]|uniref:Centrosomal protein CEP104 N-terminal domain-containing protein n=1 Tax=Pristionchus entomophagus TaxID=358040 RepID=A0AAV5T4J3_9BILA|nr:hypothetical protein PENTCL1PPCAC_11283 [Pristionchus entomophagus]
MESASERRRPYRIAFASSDEGGLDSSAALQQRDADTGWMSAGKAEQSELILDLGQIINITRISIRAHPICAAKKIQVFGSKSKNHKESRYTYLGELHFQLDLYGDLKLLFLDTRQRYVMLILSKPIDDHQNPNGHVALEFVEICGRPRGDMEDTRSGSSQGDIAPNIPPSPVPQAPSAHSSRSTASATRVGSATTNFCGLCGRRANSGDAFCRGCGECL